MAIVKRLVKGSALTHSELDGNFTDLDSRVTTLENTNSDSQTLTLNGTDLVISNGNTVDLSSLSGGGGSSYGNSDVDTHLNTSTATANQILSWDGSDYAWVADQTGAGSSYGDSDVATYLNGNLDSHIIPDTNATYDIGSAEYKIRHFYLSDNSLKFTDTSDPLNIVEYSMGRTGTDITFNGSALKSTSSEDVADTSTIDITKTNHFVTNGTTATLPNGTYMGQKLDFWRSAGNGAVDITVNSAIYIDGGNVATGPGPIVWRLGDANQTLYSCIWNGVAWVLSHGGPAV